MLILTSFKYKDLKLRLFHGRNRDVFTFFWCRQYFLYRFYANLPCDKEWYFIGFSCSWVSVLGEIEETLFSPQIVPPIYYTRIWVGKNLQKFVGKLNFLLLIFWLDSLSTSMVSKIMRFNNSVASITKKLLRNGGIFFSHFVSNSYLLPFPLQVRCSLRIAAIAKKLKDKK